MTESEIVTNELIKPEVTSCHFSIKKERILQ